MSRIAYVNGRYVPHADAAVHIEDRGYQFADGVYEVCEVRGGRLVDKRRHLDRLDRSLGELAIALADDAGRAGVVLREVVAPQPCRRTAWSISRSRAALRRAITPFPSASVRPSLVVTAQARRPRRAGASGRRRASRSSPCRRTAGTRVDIKTVGLLPNVLAKQKAKEAGA